MSVEKNQKSEKTPFRLAVMPVYLALVEMFPKLFDDLKTPKPLALGVFQTIKEHHIDQLTQHVNAIIQAQLSTIIQEQQIEDQVMLIETTESVLMRLKAFFREYTNRLNYHNSVILEDSVRFNLDGNACGIIEHSAREFSVTRIQKILSKRKAKEQNKKQNKELAKKELPSSETVAQPVENLPPEKESQPTTTASQSEQTGFNVNSHRPILTIKRKVA